MLDIIKKYRIFFGTFVVFSIITISLFYNVLKPSKKLPIYNPADVNPELVDSTVQYIAREHKIADFSFIIKEILFNKCLIFRFIYAILILY